MPICLRSQPSCHASLNLAGYSNLLNGDISENVKSEALSARCDYQNAIHHKERENACMKK